MSEYKNFWSQDVGLSQLHLYRDWDFNSSHADSLRSYLHQQGTVPEWNFMLCGGKPELANPNSWAFTWQSLLIYLLPNYWPFFVAWMGMTVFGGVALFHWLKRFVPSPAARATAAVLFCLNGFFASHFNQGHVGFAFFHLVPILLWLYDRWADRQASGRATRWDLLWIGLATFALFTSAIPHGVFHFYPLFVVYVGIRAYYTARANGGGRKGWAKAWAANRNGLIAHGLGFWIALYKFWPIASWQMEFPRIPDTTEDSSPIQVALQTLRFFADYIDLRRPTGDPGQVWSAWEYNVFIGPLPWIAIGVLFLARPFHEIRARWNLPPWCVPFAFGLVIAGHWLAMGNGQFYAPAFYFKYLPFLSGLRVFARFQILSLFGLAILVALTVQAFEDFFRRRAVAIAAGLAIVAGGVYQSASLGYHLYAASDAALDAKYHLARNTGTPRFAAPDFANQGTGNTQQSYLLRQGYWVSLCYEALMIPSFQFDRGPQPTSKEVRPVTNPAPLEGFHLDGNTLDLAYAPTDKVLAAFPFNVIHGFELKGVQQDPQSKKLVFAETGEPIHRLQIRAHLPADSQGLMLAILGLCVAAGAWIRHGRGAGRGETPGQGTGTVKAIGSAKGKARKELPKKKFAAYVGVLVAATLLVFIRVPFFDFVNLDDPTHIAHNPSVLHPSIDGFAKIWQEPYRLLYVPFTYTAWAILSLFASVIGPKSEAIPEVSAFLFHTANVLFHAGNATLVFWILVRLTGGGLAALAGALLFALHPFQVEPVAWVSGFKDTFSMHFALWSTVMFLRSLGEKPESAAWKRAFAFSIGFFLLALLSKPTFVGLPLVLWAMLWLETDTATARARGGWFVPMFFFSAVFALMTMQFQGPGELSFQPLPLWKRPFVALDSLGFYLGKLSFLGPFLIDYGRSPGSVVNTGRVQWTVIPLGLFATAWLAFPGARARRHFAVAGAIALVGFLPVLGLQPFVHQMASSVADRYAYFPMFGAALALAAWLAGRGTIAVRASFVALGLLGFASFFQTAHWADTRTLFSHCIRFQPHSWLAQNNLGSYYEHGGRSLPLALFHYERAGQLDRQTLFFNNAGSVAMQLGLFPRAIQNFQMAVALNPNDALDYHNLALAYLQTGDLGAAKTNLKRAMEIKPGFRQPASLLEEIEKHESQDANAKPIAKKPSKR